VVLRLPCRLRPASVRDSGGSSKLSFCGRLPAGECAARVPRRPIPSCLARSCSGQSRWPLPLLQCHHSQRRTPPPPQPDDGRVRGETARPPKTALGWAQDRSPLQYRYNIATIYGIATMGDKPSISSSKSRFGNFLTGPNMNPKEALRYVTCDPLGVGAANRRDNRCAKTLKPLECLTFVKAIHCDLKQSTTR
jgi:hypothetical protein